MRDAEQTRQRRQQQQLALFNKHMEEKRQLRKELVEAKTQVRTRKAELQDYARLLATQSAARRFSLEYLGEGSRSCGGAAANKRRGQVLDRMSRTGSGLSAAQRNEFGHGGRTPGIANWRKSTGRVWGSVLASWMQHVLDQLHGWGEQRILCAGA